MSVPSASSHTTTLRRAHTIHSQGSSQRLKRSSTITSEQSSGGTPLRVTVAASGHNLLGQDFNLLQGRTGDPYLVFKQHGCVQGQTEVVYNTLNPVWKPRLLTLRRDGNLLVQCFDSHKFSADGLVGEAQIPVKDLLLPAGAEVTLLDPNGIASGIIQLKAVNVYDTQIDFFRSVVSSKGMQLKSGTMLKRVVEREVDWFKRSITLYENVLVFADPEVGFSPCCVALVQASCLGS
jgi:hypothetical protein